MREFMARRARPEQVVEPVRVVAATAANMMDLLEPAGALDRPLDFAPVTGAATDLLAGLRVGAVAFAAAVRDGP
jgi:hypothetical protein